MRNPRSPAAGLSAFVIVSTNICALQSKKSPDQTNPMQLQLLCWDLKVQVLEIPTCAIWHANMSEK